MRIRLRGSMPMNKSAISLATVSLSMSLSMILLLSLLYPDHAHAQIFSCKDSRGRTLTSDREIPECAARDMREIGKSGIIRRVIPAPLTAEQRRAKQLDEARAKQQADAVIEERRRDQALLARYRNEDEIERAYHRALGDLQEKKRQSDISLASAMVQLKNAEADGALRKSKILPPYLQQRIEDAKTTVAAEMTLKKQIVGELSALDQSFDETRKRYHYLTETSAVK